MIADDVGKLKIRPLTPELLDHAMRKLNEDPKRREADVQAIRDWLKKQPHIIGQPDDQMIITFLRGCKFSLERTKEKLDMYFTIKTMVPELFKNRDLSKDEKLKEILNLGFFFPVGLDEEGRKVYMWLGGKDEPGKYKVEDVMKVNFMMMDYMLMHDDESVVKGTVSVMDMAQMKLAHSTQMMPSFIKKVTVCSEEGYPFRPQAMHFINMASFLNSIFKLFQSFSKEKINRRTFVHGKDLESLYKKVPRESLPKEYGGDAGSVEDITRAFNEKVIAFNDWFLADEQNGVDEKKRVGKSKTQQDLFGMEGSFRKLELD